MILLGVEKETTTTSAAAGMGGGREQRGTHAEEMLTLGFFFSFLRLLAICPSQLEWT